MENQEFCARLKPDSFVRKLDGIGFAFNIGTRRQEVFDASGAAFLRQLGRSFRSGSEIADDLQGIFPGAARDVLLTDLWEFLSYLHLAGFVEIVSEGKRLAVPAPGEPDHRSADHAADRGQAETSDFLKGHFRANPTVFSFQFYVTERCNESCVHCYVDRRPHGRPLPLERRLALMDELGALGTLDVTFTGGEALLSKDLAALIERATRNDLVVGLLSNLTLLTDEIVDALRKPNVDLVQTSVYSMDAGIHDAITRRQGSLMQTRSALERLRSAGIRVSVSCPILRENRNSFEGVLRWGAEEGIPVNCDFSIMAREDGDTSNLAHRIGSGELEGVIRAVVQGSPKYQALLERNRDALDVPSLDTCGIGSYMLCVKANGDYLPCPGFGLVVGNAWDSDIADVWRNSPQLAALRQFNRSERFPQCTSCEATTFCNFCLAKFHNETGWESGVIPTGYCEIARTNRWVAGEYLDRQGLMVRAAAARPA
jgi:radical SAM protein with 4Fe4S-binding SPASM domain